MKEELSLIAVILILFVVDLLTCPDQKGATPKVNVRSLTLPAVILMTLHTVINLSVSYTHLTLPTILRV